MAAAAAAAMGGISEQKIGLQDFQSKFKVTSSVLQGNDLIIRL